MIRNRALKKRRTENKDANNPQQLSSSIRNIDSSPIENAKQHDTLIFDSHDTDIISYNAYGQKVWDPTVDQLAGETGKGKFTALNSVLTIERDNTLGRFIVRILDYYPKVAELQGQRIPYVAKNLYGPNPRSINMTFSVRAIQGKHKLIVVFKREGTDDWINNVEIETEDRSWVKQACGFHIMANENFAIEFHTFVLSFNPGTLQIKDIIITEFIPKT